MSTSRGARWTQLYQGKGPTDAYLLQHQLDREGIATVIKGETLMSIRGEIPIGEAWPTVWVDETDRPKAEEVLQRYLGPTLVSPPWTCAGCGEVNEPTFGQCWSCLTFRTV